jgi:Rrf2 family protein
VFALQLTREADYAVLCVLEVARFGRMSAAEVARRQEISPAFLGKIVGSLAKAGVLTTRRGVGGGIDLGRPAESLTLLEVVEAVQGPFAINQCLIHTGGCDRQSGCYVYPLWVTAQNDMKKALDVSIAEVIANGDKLHSKAGGNGQVEIKGAAVK